MRPAQGRFSLTEGWSVYSVFKIITFTAPPRPITPSLTSLCCLGPSWGQEWKGLCAGVGALGSRPRVPFPSLQPLRPGVNETEEGIDSLIVKVLPGYEEVSGPGKKAHGPSRVTWAPNSGRWEPCVTQTAHEHMFHARRSSRSPTAGLTQAKALLSSSHLPYQGTVSKTNKKSKTKK